MNKMENQMFNDFGMESSMVKHNELDELNSVETHTQQYFASHKRQLEICW